MLSVTGMPCVTGCLDALCDRGPPMLSVTGVGCCVMFSSFSREARMLGDVLRTRISGDVL